MVAADLTQALEEAGMVSETAEVVLGVATVVADSGVADLREEVAVVGTPAATPSMEAATTSKSLRPATTTCRPRGIQDRVIPSPYPWTSRRKQQLSYNKPSLRHKGLQKNNPLIHLKKTCHWILKAKTKLRLIRSQSYPNRRQLRNLSPLTKQSKSMAMAKDHIAGDAILKVILLQSAHWRCIVPYVTVRTISKLDAPNGGEKSLLQ
jgi:hypothetical protein